MSSLLIRLGTSLVAVFVVEMLWANLSPGGFEYNFVSRWPPLVVITALLLHFAGFLCIWIGFRLKNSTE